MRPDLRVITAEPVESAPLVRFCGYCNAIHESHGPEQAGPGICHECEMGVVLSASALVAPKPGEPALVIDGALSICAVSSAAEELLGVEEPDTVNHHIAELLVPADAEARGAENLISLIVSAARGDVPSASAVVRPAGVFGVRYLARVGACGPKPSALVVLSDEDV